jgi:hypothetical protein
VNGFLVESKFLHKEIESLYPIGCILGAADAAMLSTRRAAEDVIDLTSDPGDDVATHGFAQDNSIGSSSSSSSSSSIDKAAAAATAAAASDMAFHRHEAAVIVNGPASTGFELPLRKFLPKVDWKKIQPIRGVSDVVRSDLVLSNSNNSSSSHSHNKADTQQLQREKGGSLEHGEKAGVKGNINSKFHVREKSGVVVEYPQPVPSLIVMNFLRKHFPSKRSFMEAFAGSNSSSSSRNPGGSSSRSSSAAPSNLLRAAINNSSISGANSFDSAMRDILMFQGTPLSSNSSSNLQTLDGAINNTNAMFFISDDTPNAQSTITSVINKQQPTMSASPGQQSKHSSGQVGGRGYARGKTVASVINNYPSQSLSSDPMNLSLSTGAAAATSAELSSMSGQVGPLQQQEQQQQQLMRMQGMQTGPRYALPFTSTATNIQPYMYHPNNQPTANAPSLLQPSSDSYQQASSHPPHQYAISMPPTVASSSSQGSSQPASVLNQQFQHVLATSSAAEGGGISSREAIHLERGVQFFFQSDRSSDNPFKPSVNDLALRFQMPYQLFNDSLKRCDFPFIHSFCMYVCFHSSVRSFMIFIYSIAETSETSS